MGHLILEFACYLVLGSLALGVTVVNAYDVYEHYRAKRTARKFAAFRRG